MLTKQRRRVKKKKMALEGYGKTEDGISRVQYSSNIQFPNFRDFSNNATSNNAGTVVVDVLPQIYTQTDLIGSRGRNKILDGSPDGRSSSERNSSPIMKERTKKMDNNNIKGKFFLIHFSSLFVFPLTSIPNINTIDFLLSLLIIIQFNMFIISYHK